MPSFLSDGLELAYLDEGEGAPVLLIHGFASTKEINWVFPGWVKTLTDAGRRVIAFDHRGHGASQKLYDPAQYHTRLMAEDAANLLKTLGIPQADVIGYSMGARVTAQLTLSHPDVVRKAVLGGLGIHLVDGVGLPQSIAEALEAPSLEDVTDPMGRMFRAFADSNKADRKALAACIRGSRQSLDRRRWRPSVIPFWWRWARATSSRAMPMRWPPCCRTGGRWIFPTATTIRRWATRCSSRACSIFSPSRPDRRSGQGGLTRRPSVC